MSGKKQTSGQDAKKKYSHRIQDAYSIHLAKRNFCPSGKISGKRNNSHLIQDAHKIHLASKNFSPSEQISGKKNQSYCTH